MDPGRNIRPDGLRVALVGFGRWGPNVARDISKIDGFSLSHIVDSATTALARAREAHPGAVLSTRLEEVLPRVEAVAICSNAEHHHPLAMAALEAGRHALVEKPMATEIDHAEEMLAAARESSLVLAVGHQMLHHPLFARLAGAIKAGEVGKLRRMSFERKGEVDLSREPDALWAFAPHDVAMAMSLAGRPPVRSAIIEREIGEGGRILEALFEVDFGEGLTASVRVDGVCARRSRLVQVEGDSGEAVFDDGPAGGRLEVCSRPGGSRSVAGEDSQAPLRNACRDFLRSVRGGRAPLACGQVGLEVTRVLRGISEACRQGG